LVAPTEGGLQRGQPRLQELGVEPPDPLERALVRADDLTQDGVDLVGLAEPLRDAAEVLVDEAEPDPLGDVLSGGGPRDVRLGKKGEEARVGSPAPVAV